MEVLELTLLETNFPLAIRHRFAFSSSLDEDLEGEASLSSQAM